MPLIPNETEFDFGDENDGDKKKSAEFSVIVFRYCSATSSPLWRHHLQTQRSETL